MCYSLIRIPTTLYKAIKNNIENKAHKKPKYIVGLAKVYRILRLFIISVVFWKREMSQYKHDMDLSTRIVKRIKLMYSRQVFASYIQFYYKLPFE